MTSQHLMRSVALIALSLGTQVQGQTPNRSVLPIPTAPFNGIIRDSAVDSTPQRITPLRAPAGAPNIFLFMSDDVGFALASSFGGPVPTPNMDRLAQAGKRYNRFHTTGICSPTRAALLTGRNHHNAGVGFLSDMPAGYPGYSATIPRETATIAQTLRLNGYNTAMFGKHHNTPPAERSAAGPFDSWPTGLGFEYFFGFNSGDSDQYKPNLFRGTDLLPTSPNAPVLLEQRLADDVIHWVHNQKAAAPDKPFFIYYAPGSLHAPHQAPPEYIARFKGQFDQGWDALREESFARQLSGGIIPAGTKLTPRPDSIPAWDTLTPEGRTFAIRSMEVAAGMMAYQDEQLGRVMNEMERMGVLQNTLVAIIEGDNGAAAEVGPSGSINELQHIGGLKEDDTWLAANAAGLGGETTYSSYPAGWAWALNTPLRQTKQYASMLGGIRNGLILSWPGHVTQPGSICPQFGHVIDMAPTFLAAAGLPAPVEVLGAKQKPLDGESLLSSLTNCEPDHPRTQYFEIVGKLGLYHDGWFASNDDGRTPWTNMPPGGAKPSTRWELYDLRRDFSQSDDVSAQNPEQTAKMVSLWEREAKNNNVYPIEHRFGFLRGVQMPPLPKRLDFWGKDVSVPAQGGAFPVASSFKLDASLTLDKNAASGAVVAIGSHFAGWSLYLDRGRPTFVYARSTKPEDITTIASSTKLSSGSTRLGLNFNLNQPGGKASVQILESGKIVAEGDIPQTFLIPAGLGEMLDIGRDTGVTVTRYRSPLGTIEGNISHVGFTFSR